MVVSDQAGGVYSVTFAGKATALADKTKIKNPAGVAIGPAGFGSYEGSVFVLAAAGGIKGVCEVERIDKSGAVSTFVKLPDAAATECRDLEFGATGLTVCGQALPTRWLAAMTRFTQSTLLWARARRVRHLHQASAVRADHDWHFHPRLIRRRRGRCWSGCVRREVLRREGRPHQHGRRRRQDEGPEVYLVGFIRPSGFAWSPVQLRLIQ